MPDDLDNTIAARLAIGEGLIASARMVADVDEHRLWRMSRDGWALSTIARLRPDIDEAVLHTFQRAVSGAPNNGGDLLESLPAELEGLRRAVAVLVGLRGL